MALGGLKIKNSRHDLIAEKVFGASFSHDVAPLGRLEEILSSPLASTPLFQGEIPSCVTASGTFVNMYNSWKNSKNPVQLSWPFLYSQVKHYGAGTVPQEVYDVLRKTGQPEDKRYPQKRFTDNPEFSENAHPKPEEFIGAETFKIKSYLFFQEFSISSLFSALKEGPIVIGIQVDSENWHTQDVIQPGRPQFMHAVVLIDVDKEWNLKVVSWDDPEKLDIRTLAAGYPIKMAVQFADLPDDVKKDEVRRGSWYDFFKSLIR